MAASPTGGVKAMNIGGRLVRERERLIGMTEEERAWRARYLKSQILAPEEPLTTRNISLKQSLDCFWRQRLLHCLKFQNLDSQTCQYRYIR